MANLPDKPQVGDTGHVPDTSMIIDAIADLDARKVETLAIGTVTTDAPGSQATATIVGGPGGTHTLSLSIPAGAPGAKGDPGERGPEGPAGPQGPAGSGGGGGATDHGALDGLNDDDHPQYLTYARGDDQYATKTALDGWVGALTDLALASGPDAVAGHVAEADPHAQYLRKAANETMTGGLTVQKGSAQITVDATSGNAAIANKAVAGTAYYYADAPAGQYAGIVLRTEAGKNRWVLTKSNVAETGANAGADLTLLRYGDDGLYIGGAMTVRRSDGQTTLTGALVVPSLAVKLTNGNGSILRPGGANDYPSFRNAADTAAVPLLVGEPDTPAAAATKNYVDNVGKWQAYSPGVSGTGFTLGNGTVVARYARIGNTVHVSFSLTLGSTTVMGTSSIGVSVPLAKSSSSTFIGVAALGSTGNNEWLGRVSLGTAFSISPLAPATLAAAVFSPTAPFTWKATDTIRFVATYETDAA